MCAPQCSFAAFAACGCARPRPTNALFTTRTSVIGFEPNPFIGTRLAWTPSSGWCPTQVRPGFLGGWGLEAASRPGSCPSAPCAQRRRRCASRWAAARLTPPGQTRPRRRRVWRHGGHLHHVKGPQVKAARWGCGCGCGWGGGACGGVRWGRAGVRCSSAGRKGRGASCRTACANWQPVGGGGGAALAAPGRSPPPPALLPPRSARDQLHAIVPCPPRRYHLPRRTLVRMMVNQAIDSIGGICPLLGDFFDAT